MRPGPSQLEQRRSALAHRAGAVGADVMKRRANLRREIEAGETPLQSMIGQTPWWLKTASLGKLVLWLPGVGEQTSELFFTRLGRRAPGITQTSQVGKLTLAQRRIVREELGHL